MPKTTPARLHLALFLAVGCLCWSLFAQAPVAPASSTEPASNDAAQAMAERVASLLEMPKEARRAQLQAMKPEERRGLWFELKKAQWGAKAADKLNYKAGSGRSIEGLTPAAAKAIGSSPEALAVGTIQYDSGAPTVSFSGGQLVGNQFDTHTGIPVFASGTVSTVQAVVVEGSSITTSNAGFVLHGPITGGGGATALFSTFTTASGTADTVTFTGLGVNYPGSSFLVLFGDFSSSYVPVFGPGTTNGQGFHGMVGYTGGAGPNITGTFQFSTLNAFVRATGNIVPVELMTFQVD